MSSDRSSHRARWRLGLTRLGSAATVAAILLVLPLALPAQQGVIAGVVVDARDIAKNPQLLHRRFFETEHHAVSGECRLPVGAWKFASHRDPWMRRPAPTLGEHNDEVFRGLLGMADSELDRLRADGIIGEVPKGD